MLKSFLLPALKILTLFLRLPVNFKSKGSAYPTKLVASSTRSEVDPQGLDLVLLSIVNTGFIGWTSQWSAATFRNWKVCTFTFSKFEYCIFASYVCIGIEWVLNPIHNSTHNYLLRHLEWERRTFPYFWWTRRFTYVRLMLGDVKNYFESVVGNSSEK